MEALRVAPIFGFNEVYERLTIAARLFDKIHITDDARVRKPLHRILKSRYRRDLGEISGELHLLKLLVDVSIGNLCVRIADCCEVFRPEARYGNSFKGG